jgi:hypothetical protein
MGPSPGQEYRDRSPGNAGDYSRPFFLPKALPGRRSVRRRSDQDTERKGSWAV